MAALETNSSPVHEPAPAGKKAGAGKKTQVFPQNNVSQGVILLTWVVLSEPWRNKSGAAGERGDGGEIDIRGEGRGRTAEVDQSWEQADSLSEGLCYLSSKVPLSLRKVCNSCLGESLPWWISKREGTVPGCPGAGPAGEPAPLAVLERPPASGHFQF